MSIFGWGGETKGELKDKIVSLNETITEERDARVTAEIEVDRVETKFRAEAQNIQGDHEVEVANLHRKIDGMKASFEGNLDAEKVKQTKAMRVELEQDKVAYRKELKAEYQTNLDTFKKESKSAKEDAAKFNGLYGGALLVIKALEQQLKDSNALNTKLIGTLPQVSATITTPSNNVTVGSGNKS